jgi:hypothetical protein
VVLGGNGAAGVLAAGLAVGCSIAFSVDATIRVGAICYLLLAPVALSLARREPALVAPKGRQAGARA